MRDVTLKVLVVVEVRTSCSRCTSAARPNNKSLAYRALWLQNSFLMWLIPDLCLVQIWFKARFKLRKTWLQCHSISGPEESGLRTVHVRDIKIFYCFMHARKLSQVRLYVSGFRLNFCVIPLLSGIYCRARLVRGGDATQHKSCPPDPNFSGMSYCPLSLHPRISHPMHV